MELTDTLRELPKLEGFESGNPADENAINKIETQLNVKLPSDYQKFLKIHGYINCDIGEIYGFSNDEYFDIILKTEYARNHKLPDFFQPIPDNTVVLNRYAGGGYYILYCKNSKRCGQISLILDETFYNEEQFWNNLSHFIEDQFIKPDFKYLKNEENS